ncbi:reverse transcriptase domain-containing protein [Tanacetum coccineum]
MPITTTMFAATTPENTPLAYRASTSTNPNPMISPAFMKANYETLESLLRDRRRQMRNNNLRTELEYFNEDYDEEREMKPRLEPARAVTPPLRAASPRVCRRRERVVGFEETQNRGESRVERSSEGGRPSEEASRGNGSQNVNLPPLLAAHIGRSENGQPLQSSLTSAYGGQALPNNVRGNLPPNAHGLPFANSDGKPSYRGKLRQPPTMRARTIDLHKRSPTNTAGGCKVLSGSHRLLHKIEGTFLVFCKKLKTLQAFTSVYHPQANGQVELTNIEIVKGMEQRLGMAHQAWVDELPQVLWAHRTTPKSSNGEIPFSLVYGSESVIPIEISVETKRVQDFDSKENKKRRR